MLKIAADENFNNNIIRGLMRRNAELDVVRIQDVGLSGATDPDVLAWAGNEGRIFVTHDVSTITHFAYLRVRNGEPMPGVIEVGRRVSIGQAIEDLLLLIEYSDTGELEGQIIYLPLE